MNRARRLRRHMAGYPAWKRKLLEKPLHPDRIPRNVRVELAISPLQPGIGNHCRSAMARAGDINHVQGIFFDDPVEMGINEVEPRCRSPMPQQARLDVIERKRPPEQRIVEKIDLAYGEIICCPPITLDPVQLIRGKRLFVFSQRLSVRHPILQKSRSPLFAARLPLHALKAQLHPPV